MGSALSPSNDTQDKNFDFAVAAQGCLVLVAKFKVVPCASPRILCADQLQSLTQGRELGAFPSAQPVDTLPYSWTVFFLFK